MGSEGPSVVTVHVTGFKKFHGVSENPTETIVTNLKQFMQKKGLPKGLVLGSCNVLETAGEGALVSLYDVFERAVSRRDNESSNTGEVILRFLHPDIVSEYNYIFLWDEDLGVENFDPINGASRFAIESQAVNEATFRCPDELGWKPQRVPIVSSDGNILRVRETSLPLDNIVKSLTKMGYDVMPSDDAGRFVCNYVYYHSLRFAEKNGIKSLFVHVPLFLTIDEATQMDFVASLLEVLASLH